MSKKELKTQNDLDDLINEVADDFEARFKLAACQYDYMTEKDKLSILLREEAKKIINEYYAEYGFYPFKSFDLDYDQRQKDYFIKFYNSSKGSIKI